MGSVFISYASEDRYFAELLGLKLVEAGISVWRDTANLIPGSDWRQAIDLGIRDAAICIVVLSKHSAASHYVTYEWATAMAQDKTIIPLLLEDCDRHSKIEPIQFIDFRSHAAETWQRVSQRVNDALANDELVDAPDPAAVPVGLDPDERAAEARIVAYLNRHGYRMVSNEGVRMHIDPSYGEPLLERIAQDSLILTSAILAGQRTGLKLI